jgi:succinyl-CoA synthetase beta subunit
VPLVALEDPPQPRVLAVAREHADPHGVVARTLAALSDLALSNPDIESVEVNPLIVGSTDTVAVDALVVLAD